jgi:hypothetical protein
MLLLSCIGISGAFFLSVHDNAAVGRLGAHTAQGPAAEADLCLPARGWAEPPALQVCNVVEKHSWTFWVIYLAGVLVGIRRLFKPEGEVPVEYKKNIIDLSLLWKSQPLPLCLCAYWVGCFLMALYCWVSCLSFDLLQISSKQVTWWLCLICRYLELDIDTQYMLARQLGTTPAHLLDLLLTLDRNLSLS